MGKKGSSSSSSSVLGTLAFLLLFAVAREGLVSAGAAPGLLQINDDNWGQILEGEWMVEFFAPWCPACRNLQPIWEDFASWSNDLGIKVAQVDITSSPGLSGRFMITALPTIFHVKEGIFRQYKGSRSKDELLGFVEEKRWEKLEPISSWSSPSSIQMTLVSQFYKVSMQLRNLMNVMLEEYGIPSWAAYLLFGVATIVVGLILGLLLVCVIDFIYPPGPPPTLPIPKTGKSSSGKSSKKDKDSDEEFTEEIQDESQQETDNEEEQEDDEDINEENDSQEGDSEKEPKEQPPSPAVVTRRRRRD